jgi:thymidylate kinase
MFIILEGIDCAGKTYVGEYLSKNISNCFFLKQLNIPKQSTASSIDSLKETYHIMLKFYRDLVAPFNGNLVVDRFFPSELVYSKIKRGYEALEDPFYYLLEGEVKDLDHALLYIHAPMSEVKKRMEFRGDSYIDFPQLEALEYRYTKYLDRTTLNTFPIRSGSGEIKNFIQEKGLDK